MQILEQEDRQVTLRWTPGHQGFEINEIADKMARKGCAIPADILPETLSYHAEKRSKSTLKKWREQTKLFPFSATFDETVTFPPTVKPNEIFKQLANEPEVFGRLTQIRTMHGYNPSYFHRFNIPHDPVCSCNHQIPPVPATRFRDHILHSCESYKEHRKILTEVHRDHSPTVLLGSKKGLLAMAKFLKVSGAFTSNGLPYKPPETPELPGLRLLSSPSPSEVPYEPP
jgi:hypothetical protein